MFLILLFGIEVFAKTFTKKLNIKQTIRQLYFVANESAPIVIICVAFAAVVTILESSFHMKLVIQNDSMVPGFAAIVIMRELGPLVTCLMITARVGAGWAAETGTMKITEQLDALKLLGLDPVSYIVVPRLIASVAGCMILTAAATVLCILFSMAAGIVSLGYTPGMFLSGVNMFSGPMDLLIAVLKGGCFGALIPIISCFYGFRCKNGAQGVGMSTTYTLVVTTILIILLDFILNWVFSPYYELLI